MNQHEEDNENWFTPPEFPTEIGIYRTRLFKGYEGYSYWDGELFSHQASSIAGALYHHKYYDASRSFQGGDWCGKPKRKEV